MAGIMDKMTEEQIRAGLRFIYEKRVDLKREVENKMNYHTPGIEKDFIHRVIAFSLSGTDIVDLQNDRDDENSDINSR